MNSSQKLLSKKVNQIGRSYTEIQNKTSETNSNEDFLKIESVASSAK